MFVAFFVHSFFVYTYLVLLQMWWRCQIWVLRGCWCSQIDLKLPEIFCHIQDERKNCVIFAQNLPQRWNVHSATHTRTPTNQLFEHFIFFPFDFHPDAHCAQSFILYYINTFHFDGEKRKKNNTYNGRAECASINASLAAICISFVKA